MYINFGRYIYTIDKNMDNYEDIQRAEIDKYYAELLGRELGDQISAIAKIPESVYSGELAFAMMMYCINRDTPPQGISDYDENKHRFFYKIKITQIDRDKLMLILTSINSVLPLSDFQYIPFGTKKSNVQKELSALSIGHMGKWVTSNKDKTYTLEIKHLTYKQSTIISRILFNW